MSHPQAPHAILELADHCMSVTRDIMRGREVPLADGPDTAAVEAMLAIVAAIDNGRIARPTGWDELRDRVLAMYARLQTGARDIGTDDPAAG